MLIDVIDVIDVMRGTNLGPSESILHAYNLELNST